MDTERRERPLRQVATATDVEPQQRSVSDSEVWCAACQRFHQQRHLCREAVGTTIELRCPATGRLLLEL